MADSVEKLKESEWIMVKIRETEEELRKNKISIVTADCYMRLLEIHTELWKLLYFKLQQEDTYLEK